MLTPLLTTSLQNTRCFHAVVSPPSSGTTNFTLSTQLLVLQQEFTETGSQVRMAVELSLLDNATNMIVANRQFEVIAPTMQNNAYGGVVATNRAVREILYRTNRFVCGAT
jgi:cholesterol transport system auxiliary component